MHTKKLGSYFAMMGLIISLAFLGLGCSENLKYVTTTTITVDPTPASTTTTNIIASTPTTTTTTITTTPTATTTTTTTTTMPGVTTTTNTATTTTTTITTTTTTTLITVTSTTTTTTTTTIPPGELDPSFGSGGKTVEAGTAGGTDDDDIGNGIVLDSSGRILVCGASKNDLGNYDMVIWRYNADGTSLDTTFGGTGYVVHNSAAEGDGDDFGSAIAIDGSERILVAGKSYNGSNYDMAVWRYDTNGNLDSSFGGTGYVVHPSAAGGDGDDAGAAIAIDESGRILVAGESHNGSNLDMAIWRYDTNGNLDPSFGTEEGFVVHPSAAGGDNDDSGYAIVIDSSGKILVGGRSRNESGICDMAIWRFNEEDGTLDESFGGVGYVVHDSAAGGSGSDRGYGITLDGSGRILVCGRSWSDDANLDMVIWRYDSEGNLDESFGGVGYVVHPSAAGGDFTDIGYAIAIDSAENIIVAGASGDSSGINDAVVWRYDEYGTLDPTFGTGGFAVFNNVAGGNSWDEAFDLTLDSSDRILITGYSNNADGNKDMFVLRVMP